MATYCPRCGASRLQQAQFCAGCGFRFGVLDGPPAQPAAVTFPLPEPSTTTGPQGGNLNGSGDLPFPANPATTPTPDQSTPPSEGPSTTASMMRRRPLVVAFGAAVLVVALLASAVYGFTTSQTLDRTNANLATTNANLATTTDSLTSTQGELGSTKSDLTSEAEAHSQADASVARLNNQVSGLQSQLEARDACVTELRADEAQLQKISREQTTQFNRSAKDSALVKADVAYTSALKEVADDYYNAYSDAWNGSYATANSWVAEGNSASSRAAQAVKLYNAEIAKINAGTTKVDGEMAALSDSIIKTLGLCNAAAGSS
jgi:hypothetical protein